MNRKRILFLTCALLLPLAGLELRLLHLQLLVSDRIVGNLGDQRNALEGVCSLRGRILDRCGRVLAFDERSFDLLLVLEEFETAPGVPRPDVVHRLLPLLRMSPEDLDEALDRIYARIEGHLRIRPPGEHVDIFRRERGAPYLFRRFVRFEEAFAIATAPELYPGVVVRKNLRRSYPYGATGGSILGYVSAAAADESRFREECRRKGHGGPFCGECRRTMVEKTAERMLTPDLRDLVGEEGVQEFLRRGTFQDEAIGRAGLERRHDASLRGLPGVLLTERNFRTRETVQSELQESVPGEDLVLTLDIERVQAIETILDDARGKGGQPARASAVVLNPADGAIVVLATNVRYDPNDFVPPVRNETVRAILQDDAGKPLIHRAASECFQLGSIFKMVTAVAALEQGATVPGRTIECRGKFRDDMEHFHCWIHEKGGGHGPMTLAQALEHSCNVYFYQMGHELGHESIARWAKTLGIGVPTGVDLPRETPGTLPGPENDKNWRTTSNWNLAIGQQGLMASPLQAARLMCVFANGGRIVFPHLAVRERKEPEPLPISPAALQEIRRGLHDVVRQGTAHHAGLSRFDAAGKTSTAQISDRKDPHAWFAGFFPFERPEFVIVVLVEHGGSGGSAAGPLAARIAQVLDEKRVRTNH